MNPEPAKPFPNFPPLAPSYAPFADRVESGGLNLIESSYQAYSSYNNYIHGCVESISSLSIDLLPRRAIIESLAMSQKSASKHDYTTAKVHLREAVDCLRIAIKAMNKVSDPESIQSKPSHRIAYNIVDIMLIERFPKGDVIPMMVTECGRGIIRILCRNGEGQDVRAFIKDYVNGHEVEVMALDDGMLKVISAT